MELKRVVVTGLGAVTPVGNTPEETWKNLINGVSGAAPITLFDSSKFKTQFACEVKKLRHKRLYRPKGISQVRPLHTVGHHLCNAGSEGCRLGS